MIDDIVETLKSYKKSDLAQSWVYDVTVRMLFLAQFCVKYKDNFEPKTGTERPTELDVTLLKRLGLGRLEREAHQPEQLKYAASAFEPSRISQAAERGRRTVLPLPPLPRHAIPADRRRHSD